MGSAFWSSGPGYRSVTAALPMALTNASATPDRSSSRRCPYRSKVIAAVAWPSMRCTTLTVAPALIAREAVGCRRPCGTRPSMPTCAHPLSNARRYFSMGSNPPRSRGNTSASGWSGSSPLRRSHTGPGTGTCRARPVLVVDSTMPLPVTWVADALTGMFGRTHTYASSPEGASCEGSRQLALPCGASRASMLGAGRLGRGGHCSEFGILCRWALSRVCLRGVAWQSEGRGY